jgi:hypothetical protein
MDDRENAGSGSSLEAQPYEPDWGEHRREHRERRHNNSGAWITGFILIMVGAAILLNNLGYLPFANWWALFILIPAASSFSNAWNQYRDAGDRLTASARSSLFWGFILTLVSFTFLFGLSWTYLWPALLIIIGVSILLNALLPR